MRVDPERFFLLAITLAAGCRASDPARPARGVEVPTAPPNHAEREPDSGEVPSPGGDELGARCDTFPEPSEFSKEMCGGRDSRPSFCRTIVDEHRPDIAGVVVECLMQLDSGCAYCESLLCRWDAIERAEKRRAPECDRIRERDGTTWADICDRYASTLSGSALRKLTSCLEASPPPGIGCYTEPDLGPCSEQGRLPP
jgi:hypothetical protein